MPSSSFLPFLSGLAGGVAKTYNDISEQDRKTKAAQDKLVADSIQKRLETDDTLTPDEQTHLLDQYLDLNGVDKKHKQNIIQASGYFRNALAEHDRQNATQGAQSAMANPAPLTDQTPTPQGIGDVPTQGRTTQQNAQLAPPIPNFVPQTAGDLALPQQIRKATALAKVTADTGVSSKLELWDAEHKSNQQVVAETQDMVRKGELTQEEGNERMAAVGVKVPKTNASSPLVVTTQTVNGKEVKRLLGRDTLPDESPIDESKDYHMVKQGGSFTNAMLSEAQYGTKQAVVAPDGSISVNLYDKQGNLMNTVKGAAYGGFGTSSKETVVEYLDPATGKNVKEVIPLATTRTPGGATPTPATPPPSVPASLGGPVPATPAVLAPTPSGSPAATPTPNTPPPKRGSLGAKFNAPKPSEPPKTTTVFVPNGQGGYTMQVLKPGQTAPAGAVTATALNPTSTSRSMAEMAQTVVTQIPNLLSQIDDLKDKVGPGAGRWNQLWVNKGGLNDPAFAGLDQDLDLFASALVRTHFGARGGQGYREALKKDFTEAQSPEDLKTRIEHAGTWIEGYAKMNGGGGASSTPNASVPVRSLPKVNTQEQYNAIPSGSSYIDASDGKTYKKK